MYRQVSPALTLTDTATRGKALSLLNTMSHKRSRAVHDQMHQELNTTASTGVTLNSGIASQQEE